MEPREITDEEELVAALAEPLFLLFKHSQTCPTSAFAHAEYRDFVGAHPEVPTAWIDVVARRPVSRGIAERTGVRHESPQALLFRDGTVVWHASHGAITRRSLEAALTSRTAGA